MKISSDTFCLFQEWGNFLCLSSLVIPMGIFATISIVINFSFFHIILQGIRSIFEWASAWRNHLIIEAGMASLFLVRENLAVFSSSSGCLPQRVGAVFRNPIKRRQKQAASDLSIYDIVFKEKKMDDCWSERESKIHLLKSF